jgi:hypothetical protein
VNVDWDVEIGRMLSAKQLLRDADQDELWRHEGPNPPASELTIRQTESSIEFPLGTEYSSFLAKADGWPAILQEIDLFGCAELTGEAFAEAIEGLRYIEPEVAEAVGLSDARTVPIGASRTGIDIAVMLDNADRAPSVIWMAGVEIERYDGFLDFFRAMVSHNLKEVDDLRRQGE